MLPKPIIQAASNQRFLRQYRLLTPYDYRTVFDAAYRMNSTHMAMLAKPNQLRYSRLGIIVSKKQIKTAAARNKIKRALRENFRMQQRQIPGLDVVIIAYKGLAMLNSVEQQLTIGKQWERLHKRFSMS